MKGKRNTLVKPRNRESKNHDHLTQAEKCYLWMNGVCKKCGVRMGDAAAEKKTIMEEHYETF